MPWLSTAKLEDDRFSSIRQSVHPFVWFFLFVCGLPTELFDLFVCKQRAFTDDVYRLQILFFRTIKFGVLHCSVNITTDNPTDAVNCLYDYSSRCIVLWSVPDTPPAIL